MQPKLTSREKDAVYRFEREVGGRAQTIDPAGVLKWRSVAVGFFIGIGLSCDEAMKLGTVLNTDRLYK